MTSSSRALVPLLSLLLGCSDVRSTEIQIRPPEPGSGLGNCTGGQDGQFMNTYIVTLFATEADRGDCSGCDRPPAEDGFECEIVEEQCRSADDPRLARSDLLADALAGLRLAGVDPERTYCVRIVALERTPHFQTEAECLATWRCDLETTPQLGRMCALSELSGIDPAGGIDVKNFVCNKQDEAESFAVCANLASEQTACP